MAEFTYRGYRLIKTLHGTSIYFGDTFLDATDTYEEAQNIVADWLNAR